MYFALSNELPFEKASPANIGEIMRLHLTTKPRPLTDHLPEMPERVADLVMRTADQDPLQRPTLKEIASGLRE